MWQLLWRQSPGRTLLTYLTSHLIISFGITLATGRRQAQHVRRAFTHEQIMRNMWTTKRITAPRASPRAESCAGPCATPFHTWGVARGPAGCCCCTLWSPYLRRPLCTWRLLPLLYLSHPRQRLLTETTDVGGHHAPCPLPSGRRHSRTRRQ
jgi:hypothetical protein